MNDKPPFSPLMLTVVRESKKKSQTKLAKEAGLAQSIVSRIEAGLFSPSDEIVGRLAESLGCPPSLLHVPLRFRELPMTFFRKRTRVRVADVKAIRALVNLYRLRLEILLRSFDLADAKLIQVGTREDGLSPSEAAARLRVYWNVPPGPIHNLTKLVESYGVVVVPMDFANESVDGLSLYEPTDTLPPMVFLNPNLPGDRWRLSLAHELGHIILHHHLDVPPSDKEMEREAFEFAVEFSAPAREISGQLRHITMHRLAALKKHWRISMAALLMRATQMGHISERHARRFWIYLKKSGRAEPVMIPSERATTVRKMVRYHRNELGYSMTDLSKALHQFVEECRVDFGISPTRLRLE
ncbi:MAG: XRE family transcriptional regulator [Gemmatimonadota bacterium]|nr:XRE family transcriptional regulator [Gemmatimonadota bacterium]